MRDQYRWLAPAAAISFVICACWLYQAHTGWYGGDTDDLEYKHSADTQDRDDA